MNGATLGLIAASGAVGCVARYLVTLAAAQLLGRAWPWGTLAVNLIGSLAIGVAVAWFDAAGALDGRARLAITSGLLGGFTTCSSLAIETVAMIERGRHLAAALYLGGTSTGAVLACALGMWLVRRAA